MIPKVPRRYLRRISSLPQILDRRREDDLELSISEALGAEEQGVGDAISARVLALADETAKGLVRASEMSHFIFP